MILNGNIILVCAINCCGTMLIPCFISEQLYLILNPFPGGRGVWIPTTPNEAMWYGIAQWFGLKSDSALSYVLPNVNNFGCRLYSEIDLYQGGKGERMICCLGALYQSSQNSD